MKQIKALFAVSGLLVTTALHAGMINVSPGPNAQEVLQTALIEAEPGDTIIIAAGRYELIDGLSLDVPRVTVRGAGPDATILSFKGQQRAGEGLLITSDDVVLKGFAVEDARGDGIKSKGADRIVYSNLRIEWTGGPKTTNGAYGLYPVESTNVLIDGVTVRGASDAGIYVGQSKNIIVRNSTAMYNVAGIEIENSYNADVHSNVAMHNTGGILIFDLPNLPQMGGHSVRIFANRVTKNDTPNFAPKGNIVASVPVGTGVMVMANRNVVIFGNLLGENQTANILLVAYSKAFNDAKFNPYPRNVVIRNNEHGRSGWAPAFVPEGPMRDGLGAMGTAVLWDGLRAKGTRIQVSDAVPLLSLNLPRLAAGPEEANPAPANLSGGSPLVEPRRVAMPVAMEAAVR